MTSTALAEPRWQRWLPGARMLRTYQLAWLPSDVAAGVTLGAVMVPVGLAFGELAGVPLAGLYAGMAPLLAYALFGSSRQLIIGPDASMAALVAVSLAPLAGGDAGRLAVLACLLAILIGLICVLASFLRLGFVADLLAKPVIVGFMHGLAVVMAVGQLPKVLGIPGGGDTTLAQIITVWRNLPGTNVIPLAIGAGSVAVILACRRWWPRVPGQILVLVASLLVVRVLQLDQLGVAVVGDVPPGLPRLQVPFVTWKDVQLLLPMALAAGVLAFSDTIATCRGFASRNRYHIDANQELLALGLGNIASGLTQGLPVSGSGSRTATAESAGSRTQVTSMVAAAVVACVMLFLTGLFASLPSAALGGILIAAAWSLCDVGEFGRMWRFRGVGLAGALLTMGGVVGIGVLEGIGIGVAFSLLLVMRALEFPDDAVLGQVGPEEFHDRRRHPAATLVPGVVVYRFSGPLFFANCEVFRRRATAALDGSPQPVHAFVLDAGAVFEVDLAAAEVLAEFHRELRGRGVRLAIAGIQGSVRERLVRGWEGGAGAEEGLFPPTVGAAVRDLAPPRQ